MKKLKLKRDKFPINIELHKISTRPDAQYPQEERFPSNTCIAVGLMWEWTLPKVGSSFLVMYNKLNHNLSTSIVEEILEETTTNIKFKTINSIYNIIIK